MSEDQSESGGFFSKLFRRQQPVQSKTEPYRLQTLFDKFKGMSLQELSSVDRSQLSIPEREAVEKMITNQQIIEEHDAEKGDWR